MSASYATITGVTKTQYTQPKVYWLSYAKNPDFGTIAKKEDWVGDNYVIALQTEVPQGGGINVQTAINHLAAGQYKRFSLTRVNDYSLARVSGEAIAATETNQGALIDIWKREMDGAIHTVRRSACIHMWRDGTGTRGFVAAASNVNSNTLTLATPSDISNFSVNLTLQAANAAGGTLRGSGANNVVTAIDRINGILTFGNVTNLAATWTGYSTGDALLREGDNNAMIKGFAAWAPTSAVATTDSFNGLNRSTDTRMVGGYVNAAGMTIREAIIEGIARGDFEGGEMDMVWLNTRDRATLTKELEGKTIQQRQVNAPIKGSSVSIGYDVIEAEFDGQTVKVASSVNVPRTHAYVTQWNTWQFASLKPAPHIIKDDGMDALRVSNDDSVELRVVYRGDMGTFAPAYTQHLFNVGT